MKKSDLEKIGEVDWFPYLTRPLNIFLFICNALAYKKIKYIGGIKNIGYLYDGKLANYYRSKKEFDKNINILRNKIIKHPEEIEKELSKGIEINKEVKKIIKKYDQIGESKPNKAEIRYLINFYIDLFVYSTIFPYFVGLAIDGLRVKKMKTLVDKLRLVSYYSDFKDKVLDKNFSKLADDNRTKDVILSYDYTPDEFFAFLDGKKLKKKSNSFYFFMLDEDVLSGDDEETFRIIKNKIHKNESEQFEDIKGIIAYAGVVSGRVKIIYEAHDFLVFNEGDILVTINSNPSLMPVIKKCKAIISDEGGVMCHAAIVARELKKPCIIGTKIATQVLHDGDLVEVDADNGVVRIIKKLEN